MQIYFGQIGDRGYKECKSMKKQLRPESLKLYEQFLVEEEKASATISKYIRDVKAFYEWLEDKELSKENLKEYKAWLLDHFKISSANSMIISLNLYLKFCGHMELCLKTFRVQKKMFLEKDLELSKEEYFKLLSAAGKGSRLQAVMETIASTGIRVSELEFITLESLYHGQAEIDNKGKHRVVMLPSKLTIKLRRYAKKHGIKSGSIFITRTGRPLDRSNIWSAMKKLCDKTGISKEKVFPHNLRHLFARAFYAIRNDITRLADILGHSSIETTRIYILSSGKEHREQIEMMNLLL